MASLKQRSKAVRGQGASRGPIKSLKKNEPARRKRAGDEALLAVFQSAKPYSVELDAEDRALDRAISEAASRDLIA